MTKLEQKLKKLGYSKSKANIFYYEKQDIFNIFSFYIYVENDKVIRNFCSLTIEDYSINSPKDVKKINDLLVVNFTTFQNDLKKLLEVN